MIVEVRTYKIRDGQLERFLDFFEKRAVPAQRRKGILVWGPLVDLEKPDVFIWMRAFPSLEERDRIKNDFYEGDEWKNELEDIAMPMLERYDVALASPTSGFVDDFAPARAAAGADRRAAERSPAL